MRRTVRFSANNSPLTDSNMLRRLLMTILFPVVFILSSSGAAEVDSTHYHDTLDINVNVEWAKPEIIVKNKVEYPPGDVLNSINTTLQEIAKQKQPKGNVEYIVDATDSSPTMLASEARILRSVTIGALIIGFLLGWLFFEYNLVKYDKRHVFSSDIIRLIIEGVIISMVTFLSIMFIYTLIAPDIGILDLLRI